MNSLLRRTGQRLRLANYWLVARAAMGAIGVLRLLPVDKALNFADRFARRLGPYFGRHRVAVNNLRAAYPEKSDQEIQAIASDMWGNMAKLAAEYIYLETLFDYEPSAATPGRVEVDGMDRFVRIAGDSRPHILFTGHLGNFELLPITGATFGLHVTAMFRPPNNPYLADFIMKRSKKSMDSLLPSRSGAAFTLARILEAGGNVGVLVDQKFHHGIRTRFFGRDCETSPLVPKLARQYGCDVYPTRCVRLPGNRFRLELEEKLELPRDDKGEVDVTATAQLLNDTVERWVREDPGQWMWFHKRWNLSLPKRPKSA